MSDHFFLLFDADAIDDAEQSVSWCRHHAGDVSNIEHGSLQQAAEASLDAHFTVLVSGQSCVSISADLPNVGRSRMAQAVPFALEEQLIDDVDDLHFALGESQGGAIPVLVVKKQQLQTWVSQLESHDISPQRMVPEYLCIPLPQQGWHLWFDSSRILLRNGVNSGLQLTLTDPILLLQRLFDEATQKPEQLLVSGDAQGLSQHLVKWCAENEMALVEGDHEISLLSVAASRLQTERSINLLQGSFSHKEQMSRQWRPWLPATVVVGVMVLFQVVLMVMDTQRLTQQSVQLEQQIKQVYLDAFPDARRVVDAKAQMKAQLAAQNESAGSDLFYQLMGGVTLLAENKINFDLQRIRYQNDELNVDLHLPNLQILDQIKQLLAEKSNIQAEVISASARGDKVEARLLIKGGNS